MSLGGDIHDIWIRGINDDAANMMCIGKAHMLPGLACIERLVDPISPGRTLTIVGLACSHPDDGRVGGSYRDIANRRYRFVVEYRLPSGKGVDRFPDAPAGKADIGDLRIVFDDRQGVDAASHDRWAD